jgi:hypothetical protein
MLDLPDLSKYFPTDRAEPCYAVYATAIDRFLMVDRHDLSILLRAAMLFSSKMITVVCVYDSKINPSLTTETCLAWAPVHRVQLTRTRVPVVLPLDGPNAIVEKGPATLASAEAVARAQRYLMFTARVTYAHFMTNANLGYADIRMFRHMIPKLETLPGAPLSAARQLFPGQTRDQRIEEILYYADSVEQATVELDALLAVRANNGKAGSLPSPYQTAFNQVLNGQTGLSA